MTTPAAPAAAPTSAPSSSPSPSASSSTPSSSAPTSSPTPSSTAPVGGTPSPTPPGDAAKAEAARKEEIRKHKLKVNGREVELDEPEVIRRAQLAEAADAKFREAADMRKQMEQFVEQLRSDPMSILTHPDIGLDFKALAEQHLTKELQRELLSPEQRELEDLREWRREQETQAEQQRQEQMTRAQRQEMQRLEQQAAENYDRQITEVLNHSGLPKTAHTVKRVAELLYGALEKGYDLDVATAVDMVRQGYMTDISALVGGLDGDHLVKTLGDDVVKKLRKHDLAQLRKQREAAGAPQPQPVVTDGAGRQREEQPRKLNTHQWIEEARKKAGV
jgi:hypothetical protein